MNTSPRPTGGISSSRGVSGGKGKKLGAESSIAGAAGAGASIAGAASNVVFFSELLIQMKSATSPIPMAHHFPDELLDDGVPYRQVVD